MKPLPFGLVNLPPAPMMFRDRKSYVAARAVEASKAATASAFPAAQIKLEEKFFAPTKLTAARRDGRRMSCATDRFGFFITSVSGRAGLWRRPGFVHRLTEPKSG